MPINHSPVSPASIIMQIIFGRTLLNRQWASPAVLDHVKRRSDRRECNGDEVMRPDTGSSRATPSILLSLHRNAIGWCQWIQCCASGIISSLYFFIPSLTYRLTKNQCVINNVLKHLRNYLKTTLIL
ncbi:hypothetical protein CEXT_506741 [Caerostris extrusa]|uniref:Uncharacterized protein n=1 Tax=Caerostris extrusa TaxID=172846 RepID=A0AAV4W3R7_CAEEX|nr:hypothetical protein CEXT_506741 [Caerostris extrusa]